MKKINLAITGCLGRMGQQLIRSSKTEFGPKEGYRYDGLYYVKDHERRKEHRSKCRFLLSNSLLLHGYSA